MHQPTAIHSLQLIRVITTVDYFPKTEHPPNSSHLNGCLSCTIVFPVVEILRKPQCTLQSFAQLTSSAFINAPGLSEGSYRPRNASQTHRGLRRLKSTAQERTVPTFSSTVPIHLLTMRHANMPPEHTTHPPISSSPSSLLRRAMHTSLSAHSMLMSPVSPIQRAHLPLA
jgi:hypothetical protein